MHLMLFNDFLMIFLIFNQLKIMYYKKCVRKYVIGISHHLIIFKKSYSFNPYNFMVFTFSPYSLKVVFLVPIIYILILFLFL